MSSSAAVSTSERTTELTDAAQDVAEPGSDAFNSSEGNGDSKLSKKDPRYPIRVTYCDVCGLPAEVHEYLSRSQFEKCREWLRSKAPEMFPEEFPDEAAEKLEKLRIREETGEAAGAYDSGNSQEEKDTIVKVAVPIEQKGTVGKKKKLPSEVITTLAQRKGKKQVTVVYGLDLFGIKLADAAKVSKKKFATGASVARSADNRDVVEIQGTRQKEFAELAHKEFGIPKEALFIVDMKKKSKVNAFS